MKHQCVMVLLSFAASLFLQLFIQTDVSNEKITIQSMCPNADKCNNSCPNGFIINKNSCVTCECNPCRFRQPLYNSPCGQGQNTCKTSK